MTDSITRPAEQLKRLFIEIGAGWPLFPELDNARQDIVQVRQTPQSQQLLAATASVVADLPAIPLTTYTLYRQFRKTGERRGFERPWFEKRTKLSAAALRLFLGDEALLDMVQDYVWNICEETTWVLPAHEWVKIDLFSAETGFMFAEILTALGDKLNEEIQTRMRAELERRILAPYLQYHDEFGWYKGHSNWNGVCNGSVGSTFLLIEKNEQRLADAISLVLSGLDVFIHTAFEDDGASTEGSGYWGYGLIHYIDFAELLRQRTAGRIDILSGERLKAIAAYPPRVMLSPGHYANFSDCHETVYFGPGMISRMAERTGVAELRQVLAEPILPALDEDGLDLRRSLRSWHFAAHLRNLLWWDGTWGKAPEIQNSYLAKAGVVRLAGQTADGATVVAAIKGGHNAENHNQNDVGSVIVHAGGETFLCDPGPGLYSRQYFSNTRYENIFANSFGHSLPVVGERLQSAGREFEGYVLGYAPDTEPKKAVVEIGKAYGVPGLSIRRELALWSQSGEVTLQDTFAFAGEAQEVEEALVTWLYVQISGSTAILQGQRRSLHLTIEAPLGASFALKELIEESQANAKEGVLKRLTYKLPAAKLGQSRVRMVWQQ